MLPVWVDFDPIFRSHSHRRWKLNCMSWGKNTVSWMNLWQTSTLRLGIWLSLEEKPLCQFIILWPQCCGWSPNWNHQRFEIAQDLLTWSAKSVLLSLTFCWGHFVSGTIIPVAFIIYISQYIWIDNILMWTGLAGTDLMCDRRGWAVPVHSHNQLPLHDDGATWHKYICVTNWWQTVHWQR